MRLKIHTGEPDTEQVTTLKLVMRGGDIRLVAVDDNGVALSHGTILFVEPHRGIYRYAHIDPALGIALDDEGRVRTN